MDSEFIKSFLKRIISILEKDTEVHDDFYSCLCELMKDEKNGNNWSYRHYLIDNDVNNVITMKETKNVVVKGTTGMRTWEVYV